MYVTPGRYACLLRLSVTHVACPLRLSIKRVRYARCPLRLSVTFVRYTCSLRLTVTVHYVCTLRLSAMTVLCARPLRIYVTTVQRTSVH